MDRAGLTQDESGTKGARELCSKLQSELSGQRRDLHGVFEDSVVFWSTRTLRSSWRGTRTQPAFGVFEDCTRNEQNGCFHTGSRAPRAGACGR